MRVEELGGPLRPADLAEPTPGPGEALVSVRACGINFADTLAVEGKYQERFAPPFAPGMEICGVVEALGPGADGPPPGTRIAAYCGIGGLAERLCLPASACVPVPEGMPDEAAAGFLIAYGTSHVAFEKAGLRAGETVLVLGAAGGVGLTAVEIAKVMGARVIAAARGAAKLDVAKAAGADHLLDTETADIREAVKALGGADVVYDPVGGDLFTAGLRALKPEGRILPIGFASGTVPQIPANILLVKNITVIGLYWGAYARLRPTVLTDSFRVLFDWYMSGLIKPVVSHVLAFDQAEAALDLLRHRKATGKVVVRVG